MNEPALRDELVRLRASMVESEAKAAALLAERSASAAESTRNFLHYRAFRAVDLRPLQRALARAGLSSLGRSEAHVLASVDAVLSVLDRLSGARSNPPAHESPGDHRFDAGLVHLRERAEAVLGPEPRERQVRIIVTLSRDDGDAPDRVRALVARGMDVARINCAHDDPDTWVKLARQVRSAAEATGRSCRVEMDLGGPKLRVGPIAEEIRLRRDDRVRVLRGARTGEAARRDARGAIVPAFVSCSLPDAIAAARPGERISFDDGKIGGILEQVDAEGVTVRVTHVRESGRKLKPDRGINLPDTALSIPALTAADRELLPLVTAHADVIAMSFVQSPDDVASLEDALRGQANARSTILKIETARGFRNLPRILVRALGGRPFGVMIARGDLAVECGYERLAEVQEEMLWLCEAAHVPVIWATQVLDRLARTGMPTRAEVTDAAMAERAEAVMLNKGPHVVEAVGVLDNILRRMADHQYKKTPALRPLSIASSDPLE